MVTGSQLSATLNGNDERRVKSNSSNKQAEARKRSTACLCVCVCVWVVEWCVRACVCVWLAVVSCAVGWLLLLLLFGRSECSWHSVLRVPQVLITYSSTHTHTYTRAHTYTNERQAHCVVFWGLIRRDTSQICAAFRNCMHSGMGMHEIYAIRKSFMSPVYTLNLFFSFLFLFSLCCCLTRSHSVANKLCDPLINVTFRLIVVKAGVCREKERERGVGHIISAPV